MTVTLKGKYGIQIKGGTIDGKKMAPCPRCACDLIPASTYNVPDKTADEICRCLSCGYVERENGGKR